MNDFVEMSRNQFKHDLSVELIDIVSKYWTIFFIKLPLTLTVLLKRYVMQNTYEYKGTVRSSYE